MTDRPIKLLMQIGLVALLLVVSQFLLVKYGEPQATWLYCDILDVCHD